MSKQLLALLEAEIARRLAIVDDLFPAQRKFFDDTSRFKLVTTNRRAGKSHAAVMATIVDMLDHPDSQSYYLAKNIAAAKSISLPMFREIDNKYSLGLKIREARNMVKFPNNSVTYVLGSDAPEAVQAIRGIKNFRRVTIDEAGHIKLDLKHYIQTVLRPALADCQGTLVLATTPAEHKASLTWQIVNEKLPGSSIHQWSALDNPHTCKQVQSEIDNILLEQPAARQAAWFRREWLGEWTFDESSHVYHFSAQRDLVDDFTPSKNQRYVIGVDFGFSPDATAFTVVAWSEDSPKCTVVESVKFNELTIGQIAHRLRQYVQQYPRSIIVGDRSNKMAFEELLRRYRVKILPSYKMDKADLIAFLNTDLESENIKLLRNATKQLSAEMSDLTWVERGSKRIEDPGTHNDCCDSFLYAYRLSQHFRHNPKPVDDIEPGSQAWLDREAEQRRINYMKNLKGTEVW